MSEPCEVLLVRHALPQPDGTMDPGLGAEGRVQAQGLSEHLVGEPIDAVFASHLKRAVQSGSDLPAEAAQALERELEQALFQGDDAKEGLGAYLAKRKPEFRGR